MRRKYGHDLEERAVSSTTPSTDDKSESSRMNTYSDRDSTFGIRTVRTGDTHATSGNSGEKPGQRGVPGS